MIEFHSLCYNPVMLRGKDIRDLEWRPIESHNIFYPSVHTKLCSVCKKLTCTDESTIQCAPCELWTHSQTGEPCIKYWTDIDIDTIEDNNNANYYCQAGINVLMLYQKSTKEKYTVDSLLNYL